MLKILFISRLACDWISNHILYMTHEPNIKTKSNEILLQSLWCNALINGNSISFHSLEEPNIHFPTRLLIQLLFNSFCIKNAYFYRKVIYHAVSRVIRKCLLIVSCVGYTLHCSRPSHFILDTEWRTYIDNVRQYLHITNFHSRISTVASKWKKNKQKKIYLHVPTFFS